MSRPSRLTGVSIEYNNGATIVFPAIVIGIGCVSGIICGLPEKPTVFIDDVERGILAPLFPMHEYVAPVSTMKAYSLFCIVTGMVGSSCGCVEMAGKISSPSGFSGHPYSHLGPLSSADSGHSRLKCPICPHPKHVSLNLSGPLPGRVACRSLPLPRLKFGLGVALSTVLTCT